MPASRITTQFKLKTTTPLCQTSINTKEFTAKVYHIHKEFIENISHVRYYFEEIYEVKEDQLFYCNKKKNVYRIYNWSNDRFVEDKKKIINDPDVKNFDTKEYLPFLDVQKNLQVEFPIDDEEDEEI
ncbi:hypothetical protein COBT_002435 [Conglomerata obtusa]